MKFSRIVIVTTTLFCLISCQNGTGKKNDTKEKENTIPATESRKTEKSFPELNRQKPVKKPFDKEVEKKKLKSIDTLKPVVAIP